MPEGPVKKSPVASAFSGPRDGIATHRIMASHGNRGHGGNGMTQRRRETEILLVQIVVRLRYSVSLCDPVISVTSVLVTSVTSVHSYRDDDSVPAGFSGSPNA